MGDTGKALRPSITKEMARRLSLSADNNSLDNAIDRLLTEEENLHPVLIERIGGISEQGSSSGRNNPDVLRLTEEGKLAYRALMGHENIDTTLGYARLYDGAPLPSITITPCARWRRSSPMLLPFLLPSRSSP